jgi:hypothetical protein
VKKQLKVYCDITTTGHMIWLLKTLCGCDVIVVLRCM